MNKKNEKKAEILIFPTDTVPGVGCFLSSECVKKLREIKKRSPKKPFPILLSNRKDIKNWVKEIPPVYKKLKKLFPGGITLIFKGKKNIPEGVLSEEGKIGIRIPKHKKLQNFIKKNKKPLIASSANISGYPTPKNLEEVNIPGKRIIEGESGSGKPSTVLDISENHSITVLRKGKTSILEIEKVTGKEVKLSKNLNFNILFVCSANLCRSPMAEIHLKNTIEDLDRVNIRSAGVNAMTGSKISRAAAKILKEKDLKIEHKSTLLTKPIIEWADVIFVMENKQKDYITFLCPESKDKIAFLRNFKTKSKMRLIEDPAGKNLQACRKTFTVIEEANKRLKEYLKRKF